MRIVFFGTPDFAADVLQAIVADGTHQIVAVVSKPDKPQGRSQKVLPTAVKQKHAQLLPDVPLFQPKKASAPEFIETLKQFAADAFVVVAYGEIVNRSLLQVPKYGCFNIHASLLPLYRGAAPIQRALLDGVLETGVTIIKMDEGMDTGDIALQRSLLVPLEMNVGELFEALSALGGESIIAVMNSLEKRELQLQKQDHAQATFAQKLKKEEFQLDWSQAALTIHNQVRALSPSPGAWCVVEIRGETKRLKILKTSLSIINSDWSVQTGSGKIALVTVQLEGRPVLSASEFLKGYATEISFK